MRKSLLFFGGMSLVICVTYASQVQAGLTGFTSQSDYSTPWNGFGSDFKSDWVGQTTVVETTPKNQQALNDIFGCCGLVKSGTGALCLTGGTLQLQYMPTQEQRWTVNKISSSAWAETRADAGYQLAGEPYSASAGNSRSGSSSNVANLAHYAEIVTDDGRPLANASALAYQSASLNERSFSANGRVSAATILKNGATSAESKAMGTSCFEAIYSLEKDTPFSLSLDLAKLSNVNLAFSATDNCTGEVLWDLLPSQSDALRHLEWSGILGAGQYKFGLEATADSLINQSGLQNNGGLAMYDVSLDFQAESYWVSHTLTGSQLSLANGSNKVQGNTSSTVSGGTLVISEVDLVPSGADSAPEPGMLTLLLAGLLCYGLRSCARAFSSR